MRCYAHHLWPRTTTHGQTQEIAIGWQSGRGSKRGGEGIFEGKKTQACYTQVAGKGARGPTRSKGKEVVIVTNDEAIDGEQDGEDQSGIEKIFDVEGGRSDEDAGEVVEWMVRNGCHSEQDLRTGMTEWYLEYHGQWRLNGFRGAMQRFLAWSEYFLSLFWLCRLGDEGMIFSFEIPGMNRELWNCYGRRSGRAN